MTAPGGMGERALVYKAIGTLCGLFKDHPELDANSITITHAGDVEVACMGTRGVLMQWCRALPDHHKTTALVPTQYGLDEADVIEAAGITVTIRRPLVPGGAA